MIDLAVKRAQEVDPNCEDIRLACFGCKPAERASFQSCLSDYDNVYINFEPDAWANSRLRCMEYLASRGYLAV